MISKTLIPLVSKSVAGDREAFEQLLLSLHPTILFHIRKRTDCPEDAKDIHQEVSFRLFQHIASLKRPEAFFKWLRAIVAHECTRHSASRKPCLSIENVVGWEAFHIETDADCNPFARLEKLELGSALESALESLHEPIRNIFHMRYGRDMRCRDIAAFIGKDPGAVSVTIFRAKAQLREVLCGRGISGA